MTGLSMSRHEYDGAIKKLVDKIWIKGSIRNIQRTTSREGERQYIPLLISLALNFRYWFFRGWFLLRWFECGRLKLDEDLKFSEKVQIKFA